MIYRYTIETCKKLDETLNFINDSPPYWIHSEKIEPHEDIIELLLEEEEGPMLIKKDEDFNVVLTGHGKEWIKTEGFEGDRARYVEEVRKRDELNEKQLEHITHLVDEKVKQAQLDFWITGAQKNVLLFGTSILALIISLLAYLR